MPLRGDQLIGMPEAQLTLAHATVHLASAPKSNAVTTALGDVKAGKAGLVPPHLRDGHYSGAAALGNAQGYKYAHDDRTVLCRNSIRLASWSASTNTGPPVTALNARLRPG